MRSTNSVWVWIGLILCLTTARAAVPPPEQLLPSDTLALLTAPDVAKAKAMFVESPASRLWNDPAMRPFRDKFAQKFQTELIEPLEKELGIKFADYRDLAQGQATLALIQNGWEGQADQQPAWVLALDAKDRAPQLRTNLTQLRKKWADAGRVQKTETIRGVEFTTLWIEPQQFREVFNRAWTKPEGAADDADAKEDSEDSDEKPAAPKRYHLSVGLSDQLLLVGDTLPVLERIVAKQTGAVAPALADQAAYEPDHRSMFRDAAAYGWVHARPIVSVLERWATERAGQQSQTNGLMPTPDRALQASGLKGFRSLAVRSTFSADGGFGEFFLGVPEAGRLGLFKVFLGEPKDTSPPPFVAADASKYSRWRLDGKKAWKGLEELIAGLSPQMGGLLQMTLAAIGKDKDPNFDFRKLFIDNLGDDIITIEKPPRGSSLIELSAAPTIVLVGSPKPQQLALALKTAASLLPSPGDDRNLKEREFLGQTIYSLSLGPAPAPAGQEPKTRSLHFAGASSHVAFSTDAALLEEYLRTKEAPAKALKDLSGLAEATQRVGGSTTGLFGYENATETLRIVVESLRKDGVESLLSGTPMASGGASDERLKQLKDWLDFSLLPPFDAIAKYFHFTVYAGAATPEGLSLKFFAPTPPGLKK